MMMILTVVRICQVGEKTTYARTQCLCTHLTSFGGDVYVPPNTIDFDTVFTAEKFLESMPVFCTVAGMIGIYVLIIVWARHMDKKDVARVRISRDVTQLFPYSDLPSNRPIPVTSCIRHR